MPECYVFKAFKTKHYMSQKKNRTVMYEMLCIYSIQNKTYMIYITGQFMNGTA